MRLIHLQRIINVYSVGEEGITRLTMHPTMPPTTHPTTHHTTLTMHLIMHITLRHPTTHHRHPTMPLIMHLTMHPTMHPTTPLLRIMLPLPTTRLPPYGVGMEPVIMVKHVIRVRMIVLLEIATIVHIKTTMWHLGWNVPKIVITLDPGFHPKMHSVVVHSRIMQLRQHIIQGSTIHIVVVM